MTFQPFVDYSQHIICDGELRRSASSDAVDVIDPATEEVVAHVADATDAELDEIVAAAKLAQAEWLKLSALERTEALHRVARAIEEQAPFLAESMTREMGKPYKEAFDEVCWSVWAFRYYAEVSRHDQGRVVGPVVAGHMNLVTKHPLGVVGIIMAFNFPYCLYAWEAAAALGAGNAVILKPSDHTTISSLLFLKAMMPYLPKGLIGLISGGARIGQAMVAHKDIHGIAFTGSVPAGRAVAKGCAEHFKKALIETSGNDAFIVMPSAKLDIAARAAVFAANLNAGQVCTSSERFFVHQDVHDEFVAKVVELTKQIRIGNGLDKVEMGPMVSDRERSRYEALIDRATAAGANVATGGGRPNHLNKGYFVNPVVLTDVAPGAEILKTETFGPAMSICRVKNFDEAIGLANASEFGLGATVYTMDLNETHRAIDELEVGMTWINAPLMDNNAAPFGGRKISGMGSQLGAEGLDQFRHSKMVMIDPACSAQDFWWFPYSDAEAFGGAIG